MKEGGEGWKARRGLWWSRYLVPLFTSLLSSSPVCGCRLLISSRQVSPESPESPESRAESPALLPPVCPPELRERERSHLSEMARGDQGVAWWPDNGDKHHILFNTKQHHGSTSRTTYTICTLKLGKLFKYFANIYLSSMIICWLSR